MSEKYIIGVQIETDQWVSIQNIGIILMAQLSNGTARIVSAEIVEDEKTNTEEAG
jgi:hypothetical protein